jgi:dTDP-4-dehydrorhamnose reductase
MNVLVFGSTGMLGSTVYRSLSSVESLNVGFTSRGASGPGGLPFDALQPLEPQFERLCASSKWDYWINCIGVIKPYCKDNDPVGVRNALRVNALFPHELAAVARRNGIRVIQIATDCVYSGAAGGYIESDPHDALDVYGKTKSLGEVFDGGILNLRVSIVGPEQGRQSSLLEWFLAQSPGAELKGFTHHRWNGVTTLRFAQLCQAILSAGAYDELVRESHVHHYVPADIVTKYELLKIFQDVFGTDYRISAVGDVGPAVDRTLSSKYSRLGQLLPPISIAEDVRLLSEVMAPNRRRPEAAPRA